MKRLYWIMWGEGGVLQKMMDDADRGRMSVLHYTPVSNGYLAQSKEGRFTEVTSSNMQLNRIFLTEPLLIFKFTEYLVFKYYLT